jgi:gamma-glutamyltranspeptidase/glutathione hydrolase
MTVSLMNDLARRRGGGRRRTRAVAVSIATFVLAGTGGAIAGSQAGVSGTPFGTSTSLRPPDPGAAVTAVRGDRQGNYLDQSRSEVLARHGVVATSQPLGTEAGLQVLRAGGNAADAAVATAAEMGVVEPYSAGIGGDMFLEYFSARSHRLYAMNASGWSPKSWTRRYFNRRGFNANTGMPENGLNSITVPGAVDGWAQLLKRFGTMSFRKVLAPAIETAQQGFGVTERIHSDWNTPFYTALMRKDRDSARTFLVHGQAPRLYSIFRNPGLARAYELIAKMGPAAFYRGPIGKAIVAKVNRMGAHWVPSDLSRFHAQWVTPIHTNYKGYDVYETPPNSQGFATLEMLNIIEQCGPRVGYNLAALGPRSADFWAALVEAKRLAFRDLNVYDADPRFTHVPLSRLLSKSYAASLCQYMNLQHEPPIPPLPAAARAASRAVAPAISLNKKGDTVYLTVADRWGNMASFIFSIYDYFGSGITVPGFGFPLQDRGYFFSLDPASPNVVAPRKRPFHTIIPAFVMKNGQPLLSFGSMGGTEQVQAQAQELVNMIDLGMNLQAAGDAARFFHLQGSDELDLESNLYDVVGAQLKARGFNPVSVTGDNMGGYQAILFTPMSQAGPTGGPAARSRADRGADRPVDGIYRAASDFRKDGMAAGW